MNTFFSLASPVTPSPLSLADVLGLFVRLLTLKPLEEIPPSTRRRRYYQRLWTPLITLWYLLWQRLQADSTLDQVVVNARNGGADRLCPAHAPLSQRIRSRSSASFSNARQRLSLRWLRAVFQRFTTALREGAPNRTWKTLEVGLLDGSTFRARAWGNILKRWSPARNQQGESDWCLVRVVVVFCAATGLVLGTRLGPVSVSEQTLALQVMLRGLFQGLWLGDRNFGVWSIVRGAVQSGGHALVRLSQARARCLLGRELSAGLDQAVVWQPSSHDQDAPGLERLPVAGRLLTFRLERKGFRPTDLYLFTTLADAALYPPAELLELYGVRWHAELNLRHLKSQMKLAQVEVRSARMAMVTWETGLLAYNLVRGVMIWAGTMAGVSPLQLSFQGTRRRLVDCLKQLRLQSADPDHNRRRLAKLLEDVAATRQPKRRKERPSEPRAKRHVPESYPNLRGSRAEARRLLEQNRKC